MSAPPHVVLIMADHLRRDCLSCYGDLQVRTPNLDALAEESVIFDQAYCATPLCRPTRTAMYTGKWPHTNGCIVNGGGFEKEMPYATAGRGHGTVYEALDGAGYQITSVGVDHCGTEPALHDRVPNARFVGRAPYAEDMRKRGLDLRDPEVEAARIPNLEWHDRRPVMVMRPQARRHLFSHAADDFLDVWWSHQAAGLISELDPSRPQYIETLFWAPHPPLTVPEPYYSMYPPETVQMPETVGRWYPGQPPSLLVQSCGQMGAGRTREEYREGWSAYLGLAAMVDDCVGRVVSALKDAGIWDDALVIFTQDHGELMGCHHLCQKHCSYEEAAHLPLLIKPPGGATGRRRHFASAIDYCPTVCSYAGVEPPDGVQGRSLRPAVEDENAEARDAVFIEYNGDFGRNIPMRTVVADVDGHTWKYIYTQDDVDELYDLTADPLEKESLVASSEHQTLRRQLRARLIQWMHDTGDFLELAPL